MLYTINGQYKIAEKESNDSVLNRVNKPTVHTSSCAWSDRDGWCDAQIAPQPWVKLSPEEHHTG